MSQDSSCGSVTQTVSVHVEDLMDGFVQDGGLDIEKYKMVETHPMGFRDVNYAFNTQENLSLRAHIYWFPDGEGGLMRQYFHMEIALTKIVPASSTALLILALGKNQNVHAPIRLALSDDLLVLSSRFAVDGLHSEYIRDIVFGMIPFGVQVLDDLRKELGIPIPTVLEAIRQEKCRAGLH